MKISARNVLKGKITKVIKGATTSHILIDVNGATVTSSITNAVEDLKLKEGMSAYAIIKSSDDRNLRLPAGCDLSRHERPVVVGCALSGMYALMRANYGSWLMSPQRRKFAGPIALVTVKCEPPLRAARPKR